MLPLTKPLFIYRHKTRIVVVAISIVTTTILMVTTIKSVAFTHEIVTTTILAC